MTCHCSHTNWILNIDYLCCNINQLLLACCIDMLPNNPAVEVGHTLVLNCTILSTYSGNYSSSEICFGHNNERYCGSPDVVVIDSHTAQLRFANMTLDNSGHFNCELPDLKGQLHAKQSVAVASKYSTTR